MNVRYEPSTEDIRKRYARARGTANVEHSTQDEVDFDKWLSAHDRMVWQEGYNAGDYDAHWGRLKELPPTENPHDAEEQP